MGKKNTETLSSYQKNWLTRCFSACEHNKEKCCVTQINGRNITDKTIDRTRAALCIIKTTKKRCECDFAKDLLEQATLKLEELIKCAKKGG